MGELDWSKHMGMLGWFKWVGMLGWLELTCLTALASLRPDEVQLLAG